MAGTSLRTVRHYHDIGLLEAPARGTNGYKQYGVRHLVRLLRIRRLTELGFSLAQIATMTASDDDTATLLRSVDAQLADSIGRLQQARVELAQLLVSPDTDPSTPAGLVTVADEASTDADSAFLVVIAQVVSAPVLDAYVSMLRAKRDDPLLREFESLRADVDEATLDDLAARLLAHRHELYVAYPALRDLTSESPVGPVRCAQAISAAVAELYNPAQFEVLRRCTRLQEATSHATPETSPTLPGEPLSLSAENQSARG
ncbi:DNA-binding transcriptional MerR regulator [Kribbella italica]|uniref:DNA-binding transcriptional MerR regulator n=1 Tax=Kribbella italica TaxID=1540520 RepID=A0A7W9MU17_9ACTN|nr:DNA-binding transcriptional MerR regulator [Kribbella italica]